MHSCYNVEKIGYGEYFGFQVVGTNNRFVLGDFTVTHNSVLAAFMASGAAKKGNRTLVLTHRAEILKQNFSKMEMMGLSVALLHAKSTKPAETQIVCAMAQTLKARCSNEKHAEKISGVFGIFCY